MQLSLLRPSLHFYLPNLNTYLGSPSDTMTSIPQSPLRAMFLTEGLMKLAGGLIFIASPQIPLAVAVAPPMPSSAMLLTRLLGTQTLTLGVALLLASAPSARAVGSRRLVYWTVFARDATLLTVLALQLWNGDSGSDAARFTSAGLRVWISEITPFFLGHLWVLLRKPHWF
ncbi:hypothetical protein F4775DRAFT_550023 [Biscogniauxia sp. FL1348]|nr:hypothetical protein F4775DRAFT_550023 [Biscogniauxia sp. FL1348]